MRGTWSRTRCPAPTYTEGGALRCIQARDRCSTPGHRAWDRVALLWAVVWWLRPWWPNALGEAQDRGEAPTPNVRHMCSVTVRGCLRSGTHSDGSFTHPVTRERTPAP